MKAKGFALIELIVVIGMLAILLGFMTINIFGVQKRTVVTGTVDTLVADFRSQQTKAMTGVTSGGSTTPTSYGIWFASDRYILFQGTSYNPNATTNSVIILDPSVTFGSISLPNSSVIFATTSGEIVGYNAQLNSVTLSQTDVNMSRTIHVNQYGVITAVN